MNNYTKFKTDVRADDLKPNTIYWFGCDTNSLHYYGYSANTWEEIFNDLIDDNLIHYDQLEKYYSEDNFGYTLPKDFDYKAYIFSQQGNAYYQAFTRTDEKGNRVETQGDINWFTFLEEK